jgi:FtsP/CotA-like multicopper oxidase with cupredoxin domain
MGLSAGAAVLAGAESARAQLCTPQNDPFLPVAPSPPIHPFTVPLPIPPVLKPVDKLDPPPDPNAHQRYTEFAPKKFYEIHAREVPHIYHPDYAPSPIFGYNGLFPGPTIVANYNEPVLVRIYNDLPADHTGFGIPSITTHLHNFHTASESDGAPYEFHGPGTFHDHHYAMYPAGGDPAEIMNTLWYHDHRQDFTAQNVVKGLAAFFLAFDELDSGNEKDPNPKALRLPSGEFDVPLVIVDAVFDHNGVQFYDTFDTDGLIGDRFAVNGVIQPFFQVLRRKYRFRMLNIGPSRFYQLFLSSSQPFIQISNDGNLLAAPRSTQSIPLAPANRVDVVIDFSDARIGDQIFLLNQLQQLDGRGPTGRIIPPGTPMVRFDVVGNAADPSQVPARLRPLPTIDLSEVVRERLWQFDYSGGTWLINGKTFDPTRSDAQPKQGTAEIWTFRSEGLQWSHPIHPHLEEFQIIELNGVRVPPQTARWDVAPLFPNYEIKMFMRFRDWFGSYPLHCHNVVHEDHAMMIRWDVVP